MPSEPMPNIPVSISSPKPTAAQIAKSLETSPEKPFGFLDDVMGEEVPKQALAEVTAARDKERVEASQVSAEPVEAPKEEVLAAEKVAAESPIEPPKEEDPEIDPVVAEALDGKKENFKNIRKALSETKAALKEKEKALEETSSKLKAYDTADELPPGVAAQIKERDDKIAKLSKYESIVALKTSDAYKEKFIKPVESIKQKLNAIGKDYSIPPDVMQKALELKNTRSLNAFLSDNFDVVGATEVKQLITQAQELTNKAVEAEKEPVTVMQQIEAETAQVRNMQRAAQIDNIVKQSKSAWVRSLTKISEEGKVLELIPSDTDEEFNQKIVTPIREKAAHEYGKIVKALADKGLTELDDDLGFAISKMVQLAIASSVAIETRNRAQQETEILKTNTVRNNKFIRPTLGGGVNSSPGASSSPKSPTDAADMALNQVMGKR